MHNIIRIMTIVAAFMAIGCSRYEAETIPVIEDTNTMVFHVSANDDDNTKTILQQDGAVFWDKKDTIHVFSGKENGIFVSTNENPSAYADFVGEMSADIEIDGTNEFYGLYPYSKFGNTLIVNEENTYITTIIPNLQNAVDGSYDGKAFISVAKTLDENLSFKNVCGGLRFSVVADDIKEVLFLTKGVDIAGQVNIYMDNEEPEIEFKTYKQQSIALIAPDGGTFKPGEWYYIVAAPAVLEKGFKLVLYSADKAYEYDHTGKVEIKRAVFGEIEKADEKAVAKKLTNVFAGTAKEDFKIHYESGGTTQILTVKVGGADGSFSMELPVASRYYFSESMRDVNKSLLTVEKFPNCASSYYTTFCNCAALKEVSGLDVSGVTDFSGMFQDCQSLTSVSDLDVSSGIRFWSMFFGCSSLKEIPDLNVSSGMIFTSMFGECIALERIPKLDVSQGTDFSGMFTYCKSLKEIPTLDLSSGIQFNSMFSGCTSLITIPKMDFSNGVTFQKIFSGCSSLTHIPELNMSSGTDFSSMFYGGSSIKNINSIDVSSGTSYAMMFYGCSSLVSVSGLDVSSGTDFSSMFYKCTSLKNVPDMDVSSGTNFKNMFYKCSVLEEIPQLDVSSGTETAYVAMFRDCASLKSLPKLEVSGGTDFSSMFRGCASIKSIPAIDVSSGKKFISTFEGCSSLENIPELDLSSGTVFTNMFMNCPLLKEVQLLNASKGTSFAHMFDGCTSLLEMPELNLSQGKEFNYMFKGCASLDEIPALDLSTGTAFRGMFSGCSILGKVGQLKFNKDKQVQIIAEMFKQCSKLVSLSGLSELGIDGSNSLSTLDFSDTDLDAESLSRLASTLKEGINNPNIILGPVLLSRISSDARQSLESKGYIVQ